MGSTNAIMAVKVFYDTTSALVTAPGNVVLQVKL